MKLAVALLSASLVFGGPLYQHNQGIPPPRLLWEYASTADTANPSGGAVKALSVDPTGARIALSYADDRSTMDVLDAQTGALFQTIQGPVPLNTDDIVWSPDGDQLAVTSYNNVLIWDMEKGGAPVLKEKLPDVQNPRISWSAQGPLAVVSPLYIDGELRFLDGSTRQLLNVTMINGLSFSVWSPTGRWLALYRYNELGDENNTAVSFIDVWDNFHWTATPVHLPAEIDANKYEFKNFVWLPYSAGLEGNAGGYLWRWTLLSGESEIVSRLYVPDPNFMTGDIDLPIALNDRGDMLAVDMNGAIGPQIDFLDPASGKRLLSLYNIVPADFTWGPNNTFYVAHGVVDAYQIMTE